MSTPSTEDRIRAGLAARADEVEPSPDAYRHLAQRVTSARTSRRRGWSAARPLWVVSALGAAAALAVVVALATRDDGQTNVAGPEPSEQLTAVPTTDPIATPTPAAVAAAWPLDTPVDGWPTSAGEAATRFYAEVVGVADVPIGEVTASTVVVQKRGEDGQPFGVAAVVGVVEQDGRFGVVAVTTPDIEVDSVAGGVVTGRGRGFEGTIVARLWAGEDLVAPTPITAGALDELEPFTVTLPVAAEEGPALLVLQTGAALATDVPAVHMQRIDVPAPAPVPEPDLAAAEEVARRWVIVNGGGYDLTVTTSTQDTGGRVFVDLEGVTSVELEPTADGTWRVVAARNDRIIVEGVSVNQAGQDYIVNLTGQAHTFEGNVSIEVRDSTGTTVATTFATGGGDELRPFTAELPLTFAAPGTGHVALADFGGNGDLVALTIVPVELPAVDPTLGGTTCSASGMAAPPRQDGLPPAVAATRDAIIAAALACDIDALGSLTDPDGFTASFGGGTGPELWSAGEGRGEGPLRWMVVILSLPYYTSNGAEGSASTFTWPSAVSPTWDELTAEQIDSLRPYFSQEELDAFANFGAYIGYRLTITDAGEWQTFVAGD
jgi:hypothetical protein